MRKIVIHRPGGYDRLQIEEHPEQEPRANEVGVKVHGIGVNYADCLVRWGMYASAKQLVGWPITPGFEFSGVIDRIGESVEGFELGERVCGVRFFGCYADQVVVSASQVYKIPEGFDLIEMAGFYVTFFTAYHALHQLFRLTPGSHILVHSAAGGVGSALVQLGRRAGYQVTGVVGASSKVSYLESLGCSNVIDKSKDNLWSKAKQLAPEGFDAVFDANGYSTYLESYRHLRPTGKLVVYGSHSLLPRASAASLGSNTNRLSSSGRVSLTQYARAFIGLMRTPKFDPLDLITANKSVAGFNLSFLFHRNDLLSEAVGDLQTWLTEGKIHLLKTTCIDFDQVAKAHELIESGLSTGKIVLTVKQNT